MFLIGILSYVPSNNNELRQIRIKSHIKQIQELRLLYGLDAYIFVVYQNWSKDELPVQGQYKIDECVLYKQGIGPSKARNRILEYWYNSSFNTLLMLDDDSSYYEHYNSRNFVKDLEAADNSKVGIVLPLNPMFMPFKQENYSNKNIIEKNWLLKCKLDGVTGGTYILTKYLKEKHIYFDENMWASKGSGLEDIDFLVQCVDVGFVPYKCKQLIVKMICHNESVIFSTLDDRLKVDKSNIDAVVNKWKHIGLDYGNKSRFNYTNILKNKYTETQFIPRLEPYVFTESMMPKQPKRNTLF